MIVCTDEDFDARILAGLQRRWAAFTPYRAVDAGMGGRDDSEVLEWAACEGRVLLTQDAKTMSGHALDRIRRGLPLPGVVIVPQSMALASAIEELELLLSATAPEELENRVLRLPI